MVQARVAAGEAVLWPADVPHAAWAELSEMRAIVVELSGADDAHLRGILNGRPLALPPGDLGAGEADARAGTADASAAKADGELAATPADAAQAAAEGEPI